MRIGMVVSDLLEFGGLEKIAVDTLVILKESGQQVCLLSTRWAPPDNQYRRYLCEHGVSVFQSPRWLYLIAADWPTKERLLAFTLKLSWPLLAAAALVLMALRRQSWPRALASARGWLSQQLLGGLIGPNRHRSLARLLLALWQWVWRPDVLHLQGYASALVFVLDWAANRKVSVVYTEHQTPDPAFDLWKDLSKSINKATVVVGVSEASTQALKTVCQIVRPVVTCVPGVDDPLKAGHEIRLREVPPESPLTVTTIARLTETKGLTYLLETIARVGRRFPGTRFHVYGDGHLRDDLLAYASRLGLKGEDIFVGTFTRSELPRVMAETDIFFMSSVLEGLSLTLIEAMAYGRPIVATSVGGNAEAIADGISGLLCAAREIDCMSDNLNDLLADPKLRARFGQAAREAYEHGDFTATAAARRLIAIYRQAIDLRLSASAN
jgi:glycosyltransferase involved in cell wall biosynthesis